MVDGSAALQVQGDESTLMTENSPSATHALRVEIDTCEANTISRYGETVSRGLAGHSQQALWIASWMETIPTDGFILTVFRNGQPLLALPLEVVQTGPLRIARFMGGSHANANFPACPRNADAIDATALRKSIVAALAARRADVDALVLERQMHVLHGVSNPLAVLPHQTSPNIALAVNLESGFEGVLAQQNGKKRRKKHRYQTRKFEGAGGFRVIRAQTPEETERLFAAYTDMKAIWFRNHGLRDVFAGESIRRFFNHLFCGALKQERPAYYMEALEVGGILRAVSGSSRVDGRVVCEFGGISEDDMTQYTPGEFLTFESIQAACRDGNAIYDYGVGDEHYKRLWCDQEIHHFDVILPLTAKGRLFAAIRKPFTSLKRRVKSSPRMSRLVRRLRGLQGRDEP